MTGKWQNPPLIDQHLLSANVFTISLRIRQVTDCIMHATKITPKTFAHPDLCMQIICINFEWFIVSAATTSVAPCHQRKQWSLCEKIHLQVV